MVGCPECDHLNVDEALFCEQCGHDLAVRCPSCGERHDEEGRFCMSCGYDLAGLRLHVTDDQGFYDELVEGEVPYPDDPPTGTFDLTGVQSQVGRRQPSMPGDIAVPLADPGVSEHHCEFKKFRRGRHESWGVRDLESTNGTWVARSEGFGRLPPNEPWPPDRALDDGDRIFVGCWTCLTVEVLLPTRTVTDR